VVVVAAGAVGAVIASGKTNPKVELFSSMTGKNEVPKGDADGRGGVTATVWRGKVCVAMVVKLIDKPAAAHIHRGVAGKNGPVVVPLTAPATGNPGAASTCVAVPTKTANAILANPRGYYVNVHTAKFAGGAIRGQLSVK
jgi:hypothetical protein